MHGFLRPQATPVSPPMRLRCRQAPPDLGDGTEKEWNPKSERRFPIVAFIFLLMCMCLIGPVFAQSITISPKNPSVAVTKMVQFSAKVTGLTSSDVTWYAGGVQGGSTAAGKISTGGLYTAPASLPGQNPVTVTAKSKSNSSVYGSTYVTILSAGPKITTVAPNPLTVGTVNVTITGTGFKSGATAFISYGSNTNIQMVTKSATSTTLKANGYLGPATKATFVVKNPGSDFSNALVVPVSGASPPTQYTLNVIKGTGSGSYAAGTVVTITANAPPTGQAFLDWTGATVANPNAVSTTLTMPAANTTITANYAVSGTTNFALTVVNGTGSGSYAAGTVVTITANAPPAGQTFLNWTGATVQNANASTTTLTMPSGSTTLTANYTAPSVTIPYPVTTHPRLWVTTSDLPRLQSWATTNNPIYAQGIVPLLNQTLSNYAQFFPNGSPNPNYPDPGDTQGYTGLITEQNAVILAFNSLIDPVPAKRILYAQYARNLLMYAMNQAVLGHLSNAPFRDPAFAIYNRANENGEQWALTVDWIYNTKDGQGNPILTAADKATIRNVFLIWANDCINASTTGGDHPEPIGVTNNLQLLPSNQPYRMAANNYYLGHARILTMMALSIDPSDDPLLNGSAPASQLGNTLRSYILNANGAWLYQEFAMFGDPSVVPPAYGLPANTPGFGLASGGLPPEGMLYGHSIGFILGQLLALQTAGFDNVSYSGPQIQLIGAPFWDRFVTGFLASLTPTAQTFASQSWLGPVYQFGSYGDLLRLWVTPDFMQPFSLLALLEQENGKTTHTPAARWMAVNGVEGGANALLSRISSPWSYGTTAPLLYYMLLDPTAPAASDPRPTYPTMFYDPAAGRIVAHSDWSATGTLFDYRASWMSINHQDGDGGQFELYRKGEWLTKEMSNYDNNEVGLTTVYHNSLALQIWSANGTPDLSWFENGEWANGSEWILGANAGDPTTITSTGPGYIYATSDLTNLFNRPDFWTPSAGAVDIQQATRSILWLNSDYIVIYDRATSLHSGLFKRFNMSLVTNPTISGKTATETLASGQKLFVQALLPANATLTATYAAGNLNPIAQLEPTQYILTVEDTTKPTDTRFLNVLQGADSGTAMVQATYLKSTSGTAFDGAVFGSTAVYFPVSASSTFATTVLPASSGVHTLLVTGLKPGTAYGVSVTASGGGNIITVTPGIAGMTTDSAGVLRVTF